MKSLPLFYKVAPFETSKGGLYPALILLHGRGTDENDLLGLMEFLGPRFFIVSVRAPYMFRYGGYTWFDLDEKGSMNIDQLLTSCTAFFHCLDDIQKKYPIDSKRIFLFGFSMGAMMSLTISLSQPNRFKGVVSHSGLLPEHERLSFQWNALHNTSFYIVHGKFDPIVAVESGRQAYQRLLQANARVSYCEYPIQHTISEESLNNTVQWLQQQI